MLRFVYVIVILFPLIIYYIFRTKYVVAHEQNYTEEKRYAIVRHAVSILKRAGRITTKVYGFENLPDEGGYVMFPNHQGKYDALGIVSVHDKPCSIVMDAERSKLPMANEFVIMLSGKRLDKTDMRGQVNTMSEIANEVKNGRRYILFPEGGYDNNGNDVLDFLAGAFKCAVKAKAPIVPVAIIDSYKVFAINSLKRVRTQVHFLPPIFEEEYENLTTKEISDLVKEKIVACVNEYRTT